MVEEEKKKEGEKRKQLELAMQVLRETQQLKEGEELEEDAYTAMAKKLDKQKKRGYALRQATEKRGVIEEEKKGSAR